MIEARRRFEEEREARQEEEDERREKEESMARQVLLELEEKQLAKDEEEYSKWKDWFVVEAEGDQRDEQPAVDNLLSTFVDYIKVESLASKGS